MESNGKKKKGETPPTPSKELTPYAAIFSIPSDFDHLKYDILEVKGLLYSEVLGGYSGEEGRLLTVWRGKSAYEAAQNGLNNICTTANIRKQWEGFHLETLEPKKSWLKKILKPAWIWAAITTIFAILGYAKELSDVKGWMLGPPLIEIFKHSAPVNVLLNEKFAFEVAVRNTRPAGECMIEFREQFTEPVDGIKLNPLAVHSVPAVKPNDKPHCLFQAKPCKWVNTNSLSRGWQEQG